MKLDVRLKKDKILHCFKQQEKTRKNFVANKHRSFTFIFTFIVVVVDLPTRFFPAETDVPVPIFFQSTDVVVVNFVVLLKFPIASSKAFLPA